MLFRRKSKQWAVWLFDPQPDITPWEWTLCASLQGGFSAPSMLRLPIDRAPPKAVARHYRDWGTEHFPYPCTPAEAQRWMHPPAPKPPREKLSRRLLRPFKSLILSAIRACGYDLVKRM